MLLGSPVLHLERRYSVDDRGDAGDRLALHAGGDPALAQQQQRSLARPSATTVADPTQGSALTALPPAAPPPLPEPISTPASSGQAPQIVALQVIPFTP